MNIRDEVVGEANADENEGEEMDENDDVVNDRMLNLLLLDVSLQFRISTDISFCSRRSSFRRIRIVISSRCPQSRDTFILSSHHSCRF